MKSNEPLTLLCLRSDLLHKCLRPAAASLCDQLASLACHLNDLHLKEVDIVALKRLLLNFQGEIEMFQELLTESVELCDKLTSIATTLPASPGTQKGN